MEEGTRRVATFNTDGPVDKWFWRARERDVSIAVFERDFYARYTQMPTCQSIFSRPSELLSAPVAPANQLLCVSNLYTQERWKLAERRCEDCARHAWRSDKTSIYRDVCISHEPIVSVSNVCSRRDRRRRFDVMYLWRVVFRLILVVIFSTTLCGRRHSMPAYLKIVCVCVWCIDGWRKDVKGVLICNLISNVSRPLIRGWWLSSGGCDDMHINPGEPWQGLGVGVDTICRPWPKFKFEFIANNY